MWFIKKAEHNDASCTLCGRTREDDCAAQWQPQGPEPSGPSVSVADGLPVWCLH